MVCDCTVEMYFSALERFDWVCAVTDRSQTLQYRSEGFGAVAHLRTLPSAGLGRGCDFGSTLCRATVMVPL